MFQFPDDLEWMLRNYSSMTEPEQEEVERLIREWANDFMDSMREVMKLFEFSSIDDLLLAMKKASSVNKSITWADYERKGRQGSRLTSEGVPAVLWEADDVYKGHLRIFGKKFL